MAESATAAGASAAKVPEFPLHLPSQDHGTAFVQLPHGRVVSVGPVFEGREHSGSGWGAPPARPLAGLLRAAPDDVFSVIGSFLGVRRRD